jgi:hypothetical protein
MPLINKLFGWQDIDSATIPSMPAVFLVSHSSYWDIFVVWLFSFTPGFKNLHSIAKPQFRAWYYWPIRSQMRFLYASRVEDKGAGTTQSLLHQFETLPSTAANPKHILLSPKGTTQNKPWRSGYYYFAKGAEMKIYPLILNYSTRIITIGTPIDPAATQLEDATAALQQQLGQTRVINLEAAEYPIHDPHGCPYESMFPFDMCCVSLLTFIPYWIALLQQGFYSQAALTLACVTTAWKYHLDHEGSHSANPAAYQRIEANLAIVTMAHHLAHHVWLRGSLPSIFLLTFAIGGFYYLNSIPRGFLPRRGKYVVYHSFYHMMVAIAAFSLL